MNKMNFAENAMEMGERLIELPKMWDGRASILEMRDSTFPHWRQMEWIGFYFLIPLRKISV